MEYGPWHVLADEERPRWECTPLVGVGPLLFGMPRSQVTAVLGRPPGISSTEYASYSVDRPSWGHSLTAYFRTAAPDDVHSDAPGRSGSGGINDGPEYASGNRFGGVLAAVAVDARFGPRVSWEGLPLVGRVPSVTEDAFIGLLEERRLGQFYISQEGTYGCEDVGILLRVQRAGDVVITRPVFTCPAWTRRLADTSEGPLPEREWHTH